MRCRRLNPALLLILAAALVVRLAAGAWWQHRLPDGQKFGFGDSDTYWALGRTIAQGRLYEFGSPPAQVFRTPGYPLLLAPLFWVFGNDPPVAWAYGLNAVLSTAAVGGVYWLARKLFDTRTGLIAAALVAVYPEAIAEGALVLSEAPFGPLMLLQLALWGSAWRCESPTKRSVLAIGGGVAAGLATLVRPSWLLFTPFALAIGLAFSREKRRQLMVGAIMLLALALTMTPWWNRNHRVTGHFVPTTLQVGASLYDGLNPDADGSSNMAFVGRITAAEWAAETADAARGTPPGDTFEYRLDRRMRRAAWNWVEANPGRAIELAGIKVARTWNIWPNEPSFRDWRLRLAVAATYLPLLILGLWGGVKFSRRGWPYVLCWLPAVYFTLLHTVFVGSIRYRGPEMLTLLVLAAGVIGQWWRSGAKPDSRGPPPHC